MKMKTPLGSIAFAGDAREPPEPGENAILQFHCTDAPATVTSESATAKSRNPTAHQPVSNENAVYSQCYHFLINEY